MLASITPAHVQVAAASGPHEGGGAEAVSFRWAPAGSDAAAQRGEVAVASGDERRRQHCLALPCMRSPSQRKDVLQNTDAHFIRGDSTDLLPPGCEHLTNQSCRHILENFSALALEEAGSSGRKAGTRAELVLCENRIILSLKEETRTRARQRVGQVLVPGVLRRQRRQHERPKVDDFTRRRLHHRRGVAVFLRVLYLLVRPEPARASEEEAALRAEQVPCTGARARCVPQRRAQHTRASKKEPSMRAEQVPCTGCAHH